MANPVEVWKSEKHSFDVWPDVERHAAARTPMKKIDPADLERIKWYGFFARKRDEPGRYMNRIRITAGEMTAAQAKAIAYIAYQFGHGIVDVTTRANVQVQGLSIEHLPEVLRRLEQVGLTSKQTGHDNIRNVFAHPYSGLVPDELIDTRQLCHQITELFLDSREYADLPRKMNICLNGSPQHGAHFWTQDISFLATRNEAGEVRFHLLIGGTQGQNPHLAWVVPVLVATDQVVPVTAAILDLFRAKGTREKRNAARFCFLVKQIGVEGVLAWLSAKLPFQLEATTSVPEPATSSDELIGWQRQRDPLLWTMGLSVPLGRLTWNQLEGLAVLANRWGDGQLRTTHEQGIAVINIPQRWKDAAATDAAALGLSVHADPFEMNTMACTGSQFCNIAVTETKGHMFRLIEKLRKKALTLHGIRIHMSGCPSSCAQHFTADIGLKGVRVRRLLGTREGFDVMLGGGIAGQVHMGLPYKLGVDVDQLPTLIEEAIAEYYRSHRDGQTFSDYWREKLRTSDADKVGEQEYQNVTWICEACEFQHQGEDPPIFCPQCAGLRRYFARLDHLESESAASVSAADSGTADVPRRDDGFEFAASADALKDDAGLAVLVNGRELALFRVQDRVVALDSACPHEGAPLVQGEFVDGKVTCPWHGWTFDACTGCSIDPAGNDVESFETLVESGKIFVRIDSLPNTSTRVDQKPARTCVKLNPPSEAEMVVESITEVSPNVRTLRLDNRQGLLAVDVPGRFVKLKLGGAGDNVWRSFTISSSPAQPDWVELTIKRNPNGSLTPWLFEQVKPGDRLRVKGPLGGFYFDAQKYSEPLALVSAGSGITPMLSIARYLRDIGDSRMCTFVYGARTAQDLLYRQECEALSQASPGFRYAPSLSQPTEGWAGRWGRVDADLLLQIVPNPRGTRWYLCGPDVFMHVLREGLLAAGIETAQIHTEQFHDQAAVVTA